MSVTVFEFVDLDNQKSFEQMATTFRGSLQNGCFSFANETVSGEVEKVQPEEGLAVRTWKLTLSEKIILRKLPVPIYNEQKFYLAYFLNPSIFQVRTANKKFKIPGHRNNLFFTSAACMEFNVLPKQPFYVLDIAFTASWLRNQFTKADFILRNQIDSFLQAPDSQTTFNPCSVEDYKILREFETCTVDECCHPIYTRSRAYQLVTQFFKKQANPHPAGRRTILYEQIMEAEKLITTDLQHVPRIVDIAHRVNLSISTLRRQFQLVFGQGIEDYQIIRKMEIAKGLILQKSLPIKELASICGYKQTSAFIKMFVRHYGCTPGILKSSLKVSQAT